MEITIHFWKAFIDAVGGMFCITPRSSSARTFVVEHPGTYDGESEAIAGYFHRAWGYMAYGVKKFKTSE